MKNWRITFRDRDGREWAMMTVREVLSLEAAIVVAFSTLRSQQAQCEFSGCSCGGDPASIACEEVS